MTGNDCRIMPLPEKLDGNVRLRRCQCNAPSPTTNQLTLQPLPRKDELARSHIAANPFNNVGADTTGQTHDNDIAPGAGVSIEIPASHEPFHEDTFRLDASSEDTLPITPSPQPPLSEARVKPQTKPRSKSSCMSFQMNGQGRDKIVTIDCGGIIFRTFAWTLQKFPKSRLSNLVDSESPMMQTGYIFFDRNPITFAAILEYFRCGVIAAVFVRVCLSMSRPISASATEVFTRGLSQISYVCLHSLSQEAAVLLMLVYAHTNIRVVCMRVNRSFWPPYRRTERLEKPAGINEETW
jgi:hypothetical protein